jgi:hypothetical protein
MLDPLALFRFGYALPTSRWHECQRASREDARHATLTMRTSTMWEPGTSAAHGVKAELKIRNSKFEIRRVGGQIEYRVSSIEYQVLSGFRIARTGAASAPWSRIGSATIR